MRAHARAYEDALSGDRPGERQVLRFEVETGNGLVTTIAIERVTERG
jgi:hypothetical protein